MNHTVQRDAVLAEVKRKKHPAADEIYAELRKTMPQLSLATVYRNLDEMAKAGLIRNLSSGVKQARFDCIVEDHFHIRCIECGKVRDIQSERLAALEDTLKNMVREYNFKGYRFEFLYVCKICRDTLEKRNKTPVEVPKKVLTMFD